MAFGRLQKLKKEISPQNNKISVKFLIVGNDPFSLYLQEKFIGKDFLVIANDQKKVFMGPSLLRGEANRVAFTEAFSSIDLEENLEASTFFREQRFREFGGRSKSEKLLDGEEFYTQPSFLDKMDLWQQDSKEDVLDLIPTRIEKEDDGKWSVYCSNGDLICCDKIFWGQDPTLLEKILSNSKLEENLVRYAQGLIPLCVLHLNFEYETSISKRTETIFIPVSYTHDWGHFIGSFSKEGRRFECIYHIDKSDTSEDEVAKKIKILKRSIEKIFPKSLELSCEEEIIVREGAPCEQIDDTNFKKIDDLYLFGMNAPLAVEEGKGVTHFMRGFLSIKSILDEFNLS